MSASAPWERRTEPDDIILASCWRALQWKLGRMADEASFDYPLTINEIRRTMAEIEHAERKAGL